MVTYSYCCASCSIVEDRRHSIKEDPIVSCPVCNGKMHRQLSSEAIITVRGGTVSGKTDLAQRIKNADDMDHAATVVKNVKEKYQPAARSSLNQAMSNLSNPKTESTGGN